MAYVITDACVKDFVCVAECATSAIAPAAGDPAAATLAQVYINPDQCIDCGNCANVCSNQAVYAECDLPAEKQHFAGINKLYFE